MARQLSKSRPASAWQRQAVAQRRRGREPAHLVVASASPLDTEARRCFAPVNLELASPDQTWRCRELAGASWVEAISAAGCHEVVLTARLGDDGTARHLVLELAEFLTQRLAATKAHIRVRFLPALTDFGTAEAKSA